jgi:hypothetical protein
MKSTAITLTVTALLLGAPVGVQAQDSLPAPAPDSMPQATPPQVAINWDARRELQSRAQLEELLQRLEQASSSPGYSNDLRMRAKYEAGLVRTRLAEGDFQVGDRIFLQVQGEEALSDTFAIDDSKALDLPEVGKVSLRGVLRAELEPHLTTELSRFLVDPAVRARSLVRVAVVGSVGAPGFYLLPSEALLTDALMMAGGPTGSANVTEIRIERGEQMIWEGDPLQQAIIEGRTLDQLNLRAGDRIFVPGGSGGGLGWLRTVSVLVAIPVSIAALVRIF